MRRLRVTIGILIACAIAGFGWPHVADAQWPHSGPMPDDPVKVRPYHYEPITKGLQSYRPIDPMPWGDVNRRVAPPGSLPGLPSAAPGQKGGAASPPTPPRAAAPVTGPSVPAPVVPVTPSAPMLSVPAATVPAPVEIVPVVPTPMPLTPPTPTTAPSAPDHGAHHVPTAKE